MTNTKLYLAILAAVAFKSHGQTIYLQGGSSGIGSTPAGNTNVGIGTNLPAYKLDVAGSGRFSGPLSVTNNPSITSNGTYYPIANTGYARNIISAGVRNNGYLMGFDGGGFRSDPNDAGSLASIYGMRLQFGHYTTVNSSAQTDNIIGISLEPYYITGTVGNIYGLMIAGNGGATITGNIWGIYQSDNATKNYFAGNLGVGVAPAAKLHIGGSNQEIRFDYSASNSYYGSLRWSGLQLGNNGSNRIIAGRTASGGYLEVFVNNTNDAADYTVNPNGVLAMRINANGNVGIGTVNPAQKLSVNGAVRAKEIIVDTGWSDYVFDENYQLSSLNEVEKHIQAEKHLPGIPSAKEVAENGISIGQMQAKLLAKIEELTLYIIEQEKRSAVQDRQIAQLQASVERLTREMSQ